MLTFMLHGLLHLSVLAYIILFLIMTHITVVCVSVYLHRCQAHRSLDLNPILVHFIRAYLWLTTGMSTRVWVSIHRKHHSACDTADDPHSPQFYGLSKVLFQGAELYRNEAKNAETIRCFGQGTPDDWLERNIYARHHLSGVWLMLLIDFILLGAPGITFFALQMMWIPFWAAGFINGVGHFFGYRNFIVNDASRNISPIGILVAGEELHNNHHTFPNSAKLSIKPWEFDISWFYIRILSALNLAKVNRIAPMPKLIEHPKTYIDYETLQAVMQYRYHILSNYVNQVLLPAFHTERQQATTLRKLFRKSKRALLEEVQTNLDEQSQSRLALVLKSSQRLQQVHDMRAKLLKLWQTHSASTKEMLELLQNWCQQADAMDIPGMREFVATLKRYSYQPIHN